MRIVLLIVALAACEHAYVGPAWPKLHARADGGESLAPRPGVPGVPGVEELAATASAEAPPPAEPVVAPHESAAPAPESPAAAPAAAAPDPLSTEEITIEGDED